MVLIFLFTLHTLQHVVLWLVLLAGTSVSLHHNLHTRFSPARALDQGTCLDLVLLPW